MRRLARCIVSPAVVVASRFCTPVKVPFIADSINSGKVQNWLKRVGERVAEDEVICVLETDKTTVEIRAPAAGELTATLADVGATVNVGQEVAKVKPGAGGAPAAAAPKPVATEVKAPAPDAKPVATPVAPAATPAAAPAAPTPAAPQPTTIRGADPRTRYQKVSTMRQRIADRLKASQNTAAMLTTFNEIDMTPLIQIREKHKDEFLKRHGVKLGFMSPFAKACSAALLEVPIINASWGDENIEYHDFVDISVAVSTGTGLVVPVLRDVQEMNLADIEKKIEDFATRAKVGKLTIPEMTGGTFTISNGGTYGSWMGTPIINPPQSAILGMHATKKKPWVDEKGNVVVRDIMAVALTYDHRLIDGRDAVTFLVKVKSILEDPVRLVLGLV